MFGGACPAMTCPPPSQAPLNQTQPSHQNPTLDEVEGNGGGKGLQQPAKGVPDGLVRAAGYPMGMQALLPSVADGRCHCGARAGGAGKLDGLHMPRTRAAASPCSICIYPLHAAVSSSIHAALCPGSLVVGGVSLGGVGAVGQELVGVAHVACGYSSIRRQKRVNSRTMYKGQAGGMLMRGHASAQDQLHAACQLNMPRCIRLRACGGS